ncbi:diguanylate cyclase domain-containing protein [Methylobacterium segetis]|uniref:diguanylate cyclase domain-containing protein n=1 Tax=Methylobacterium segetis TaxID=2488750 RepID=UPI0014052256
MRVAECRIPRDRAATGFVTVSVGVASGCLGRDTTSEGLIAAADSALYAAKRGGRNKIWPPLAVPEVSAEFGNRRVALG